MLLNMLVEPHDPVLVGTGHIILWKKRLDYAAVE